MEVVTLDNYSKNWQIDLVWSIKFLCPNDSVPPEKQINKGIDSHKKCPVTYLWSKKDIDLWREIENLFSKSIWRNEFK